MSDLDWIETRATQRGDTLDWLAQAVERKAGEERGNEDGSFSFIASTGSVDRRGDIVEQSWRLARFRQNPVILHEHAQPVVGRGTVKLDKTAGHLALSVRFDDSPINPIGQLVAHQHRAGFRSAVSVGFRPGRVTNRTKLPADHAGYLDPSKIAAWDAGNVFSSNELLEVSSVAIPANAEALQLREYATEVEDPTEQIARYLREAVPSELVATLSGFMRANPAAARHIRAAVLGTPTVQRAAAGPLSFLYSEDQND